MGIIQNSSGYIYFLAAENGLTKIGCTTNPKIRIKKLQAELPMETEIIFFFKCNNVTDWEKIFHEHYNESRKHGEWFELSPYDCQKLADWAGIYGEEQGVIRDRFLERGND